MAPGAVGAARRALLCAVPPALEAASVQDRGVLRRDGQVGQAILGAHVDMWTAVCATRCDLCTTQMILAIDFAERGAKPVYAESASNSSCLLGLLLLLTSGKWTMAQQFVAILMMYGNFDIILDRFPRYFPRCFSSTIQPTRTPRAVICLVAVLIVR